MSLKLAWEPFVASIPVAILVALILYVNEIPDRKSDAAAGKRTLVVRWNEQLVTAAFLVAALAAFVVVAAGATTGVLPRTTLLALLALPMFVQIYRGIRAYYSSPYELMATMGKNVQLHTIVGALLLAGYVIAIVADKAFDTHAAQLT